MFKNFGYLLLFFFALNFTFVDAQLEFDCDKKALSQEQIAECQYQKDLEELRQFKDKKNILKYQEEDWTNNYKEKESIQLKEQERIRQQETATNNSSIERIKSSRESRGKCGYLFTDTKDEALSDQITKRKGYQSDCTPLFEKVEGIDFVRSISKSFGKFNATKWTQLAKTLSSKYKTLYKPSTAEWEDYTFNSGGYARLRYMFLNETKPEVAKYISLYVDTGFNIMYVYYFSEKHAQAHLKELGKFEKQLDDL